VGLPLGRWADTGSRKVILALGVTLWSVMTVLSGLAWGFWSLFVFRLAVGVGEASCAPAANSLIGDLFPAERRGRAIGLFMFGLPLGLGLGFIIGGDIAYHYGWRAALLVAGLPGLALGLLALWIPEPPRGSTEAHPIGGARRPGSALLGVLRIPTMWWIILAGALHNFNMYALGNFLSPFLIRYHHLDVREAGRLSGVVYGFSGGAGILLGGWACDWVVRRRVSGRLELAALALTLFVPCTYLALQAEPGDPWGFAAWLLPACLFSYVFYAGVYPTIQDIVEPALRGTAMAVFFFAMYLLGASLGPVATGWASDYFARRAADADGSTVLTEVHKGVGLHDAMELIPLLGLFLVAVLFAASRTVKRDAERLQAWMGASAVPRH
jgi:predicted MFS family arabinose efflux permease